MQKFTKLYGDNVPKVSSLKKQQGIDYLEGKWIVDVNKFFALELKQKVKLYIAENEKYEIIFVAEAAGHKVLFTSPCHSGL